MQSLPSNQQPFKTPELRSGIVFGPGRSTRLPEKGSPEYQELIYRIRNNLQQN